MKRKVYTVVGASDKRVIVIVRSMINHRLANGCTGNGRPSCTSAECMYGLNDALLPKDGSCAFPDVMSEALDACFVMPEDQAYKLVGLYSRKLDDQNDPTSEVRIEIADF